MRIEMETELAFTALVMIFIMIASCWWWMVNVHAPACQTRTGRRAPAQHTISYLADIPDGESGVTSTDDGCYGKAAVYALQKHTDAITNISATQVSPQLYSNCLISAETFSMISTNGTSINKSQMLVVYDDLRCRVAICSYGFVKFVDILRNYPEYEGLANDLQGEVPSQDANKNEASTMLFNDKSSASTENVTLEAKLNIPPDRGYHKFNEVIQKFAQHCSIKQSSVFSMVMGENCVTVRFQVPVLSLPILEKKITSSEQFLSKMKISTVKILNKTVFESDSDSTVLKKSIWTKSFLHSMEGFVPELEAIGMNAVNCEHHGILRTKMSRCTVVLHEGMIYIGGGTTGKMKDDLCKVLLYNPVTQSVSSISTKVKYFSFVVINNKLATVGGLDDNKLPSDRIYSWDSTTKEWNESYPPMPTARRSTTSITYGSYLIVIGGALSDTVTVIEVLDVPNKKWYTGPSLPEPMYNVQAVVVENYLYLLGGYNTSVWYCSLPTLITGAISAFYNLSQLWKRLSSLPFRCSAAVLLGKHLLAIGGHDEAATNMTDLIHCYSPVNNCWERAGTLRTGRRNCTAVKMLDESVFVIGGADSPAYDTYCQNVEVLCLHTANMQ